MDNMRIIHTHLYSKIALEVLQSVEGNLSDGMWENSPAMEKYWRFSNVTTAPNGEVVIKIKSEDGIYDKYCGKWLRNGFNGLSGDKVLEWFAAKIKHIMQAELKDENINKGWKRTNDTFETQYLSYNEKITVSDVYFIYDFLMHRETAGKYSVKQHMQIEGMAKSEADTKAEETRRANLAKLEAEWSENLKQLEAEKKAAIEKLEAEFNKKRNAINDEFKAKCTSVK